MIFVSIAFFLLKWNILLLLQSSLSHYACTQNIITSKCINITFTKRILHIIILVTHKFKIEDRRRKVATLLAQSMTETEIAHELKVDQSTISRDIKVLKQLSQRFVFDLAKSDLAYYYKQCIDGIEEVRRKGWEIFKGQNNTI